MNSATPPYQPSLNPVGVTDWVKGILSHPFMPAVFFLSGVTYDTLTLSRIDRLSDNLLLLLYLGLLGWLIVLKGRQAMTTLSENKPTGISGVLQTIHHHAEPYVPMAIQFLLGGLFSAYAIFYFKSSSFGTTAIFFGLLVGLLVTNEFLRNRLSSMKLLVSLYTVVCFSFFTFFLPVLVRYMNAFIFLLGAFLSLAVTLWVVELIYKRHPEIPRKEKILTSVPAVFLISILVGFYYLNWIPPVPLSLKYGGMYHHITKENGRYQLNYAPGTWYQFWKRSDDQFGDEEQVYCFTAVFAPIDLQTTIFHHWQYRSSEPGRSSDYATVDRIPIPIHGGRAGGYRAYSVKKRVDPGEWRVTVETHDGRVVGRVDFFVNKETRPQTQTWEVIAY